MSQYCHCIHVHVYVHPIESLVIVLSGCVPVNAC